MTFTAAEIAFMNHADLGRLATIQPDGTPQNSPVGFSYNQELGTIDIGGYEMAKSRKFRNLRSNDKVAFVVDDITSHDPWRVRCLEIRGTAAQAESDGAAIIRVRPQKVISFGIDDQKTEPHDLVVHVRNVDAPARDSGVVGHAEIDQLHPSH
ncbi:pyridoxamine 5'-phosphate oxidase-like protein [Mycolicibacterium aurum]|uniref:Pyridoxamine 5'-phosphate oxidase-like protein n=1 Tax=Mycolicibacterium aurum TaxID=1791 RepID=A0A448IZR7_MYCAU|nr:PPOX class F420-dependent oxidoreductase [Mycolicibacterium aurum]VEG57855.1 pyridoxamine 5'-phosphate oxidase-like protein [Mycolicibacterium aurum]